jgi:hypothetical protein
MVSEETIQRLLSMYPHLEKKKQVPDQELTLAAERRLSYEEEARRAARMQLRRERIQEHQR